MKGLGEPHEMMQPTLFPLSDQDLETVSAGLGKHGKRGQQQGQQAPEQPAAPPSCPPPCPVVCCPVLPPAPPVLLPPVVC